MCAGALGSASGTGALAFGSCLCKKSSVNSEIGAKKMASCGYCSIYVSNSNSANAAHRPCERGEPIIIKRFKKVSFAKYDERYPIMPDKPAFHFRPRPRLATQQARMR